MTTTTRIGFILSLSTLIAACSSGHDPLATTVGAAGGTITTRTGITLSVPAGALSHETELRIVESEPGHGAMARVSLEPRGLALAAPVTLAFRLDDRNVRVSEVEHGPQGEVRTELERRHHGAEVEVELEHLGELEVEHGLTCEVACDAGFECDDGACQVHTEDDPATHDVGDDHGVDPAPAPGAPADDHGVDPAPAPGAPVDDHGVDPVPAPTPAPAPVDDGGNHGPGHP